nr:MAG: hypothetical protein [Bacteriophage sp.]
MFTKQPWLNPQGLISTEQKYKDMYEQSWLSQFEKAETVHILVPLAFYEDAKVIADKLTEPNEFRSDVRVGDDLCFLTRSIKPSQPNVSTELCKGLIPHATALYKNQKMKRDVITVTWFYWDWHSPLKNLLTSYVEIGLPESMLPEYMATASGISWKDQIAYVRKIKTIQLLKGNSDGLPKTTVESPNWTPGKR